MMMVKDAALFVSNVAIPVMSSLVFTVCLVYFLLSNVHHPASLKFLRVFLFSFTAFLLGRPLQVLLGPYPLPLIIVNLRVFLLGGIIAPLVIFMSNFLWRRRSVLMVELALLCVSLSVLYVVFNTLGTRDSVVLFEVVGVRGYENATPFGAAPYYGREFALYAQISIGALLLYVSFLGLRNLWRSGEGGAYLKKNLMINMGLAVFALSFIIGSCLAQWWLYYTASFLVVIFFVAAVGYDVQETNFLREKVVPLIEREITSRILVGESESKDLPQFLRLLSASAELNTAVVMRVHVSDVSSLRGGGDLEKGDRISSRLERELRRYFLEDEVLVLHVGNHRNAILVKTGEGKTALLREALEGFYRTSSREGVHLVIGVGRPKESVCRIATSFQEAVYAQQYGEVHHLEGVIEYENLVDPGDGEAFPASEKESLVSSIKLGHLGSLEEAFGNYFTAVRRWSLDNPEWIRAALYELVGSVAGIPVLSSRIKARIYGHLLSWGVELQRAEDIDSMCRTGLELVRTIGSWVSDHYRQKSSSLVDRARSYVEARFDRDIDYKEVARSLNISPSYFLHLFKRETGRTFGEYITSVRVERAKELLREGRLNVTEVAFRVGFKSSNYFSYVFKRYEGVSPTAYRRRATPSST
ncbi:transcriptional regulatory protein [Spirochaeta thermophila DSM 6192]|uniref:Transcriptional regulatory protein n=2 Tax=Winmispira thermophila TaxID=154 RepID=E0RQX1_WINT6|nr:transcriptional regulatory protein [Spirochaeta thermophila DSM 6192]